VVASMNLVAKEYGVGSTSMDFRAGGEGRFIFKNIQLRCGWWSIVGLGLELLSKIHYLYGLVSF
jgi:hypothetical protein